VKLQAELLRLGTASTGFQVTHYALARPPVRIPCDTALRGYADGLLVQPRRLMADATTEIARQAASFRADWRPLNGGVATRVERPLRVATVDGAPAMRDLVQPRLKVS